LNRLYFQGNSPQAKAIARHLSEKLHSLKSKIQEALVDQVAEDFIDITTPLKQLTEAATVPLGMVKRHFATFLLIFILFKSFCFR